jgi:hypothetical protein
VLIAFLIHARMSVSWLFVAVLSIIGLKLAILLLRGRAKTPQWGAVLAVGCTILVAWAGGPLYQRATFNPAYFGEIGPRTFWHNALMGLSFNFVLARRLMVGGTDRSAIEAVLHDMTTRNDPRLNEQWQSQNILNSLGSANTFDWRTYEDVARDLFLRTIRSSPWEAAKLFAWEKPNRVIAITGCEFLLLTCDASRFSNPVFPERRITRFLPWIWGSLLALVAGCLWMSRGGGTEVLEANESNAGIVLLLLFAALVGLAPSIFAYPVLVQLGGTVVLLLTAAGYALVLAAQHLQPRSRRPA